MHPQIQAIFDDAENRYLKPEELQVIAQYVDSLPERLELYRTLRDREIEIMQWVVDQLQAQVPQAPLEIVERSVKNALLMLRYCGMGMLLDDETIVHNRFLTWVSQSAKVYNTEKIDTYLYQLLNQRLQTVLGAQPMRFLSPTLITIQTALLSAEPTHGMAIGSHALCNDICPHLSSPHLPNPGEEGV
jgi:hypothetical protein